MTTEAIDRLRRIETKLSRFIAGEPDKATQIHCEAWNTSSGVEIEVNSMSVSLQAIINAARTVGCVGEEITICDNGKPRLFFREV